jgi:hypothetical protein
MTKEAMTKRPKNQEPRNPEITLKETKKPVNLRANAMPIDGFVLSVDTRYETSEEAMTSASKLKQSYPVIQVAIYDATERVYMPVNLQEQGK